MSLAQLIVPSGALAFTFMLTAAATGLAIFKFHVWWVQMKWHIWAATLAVIFAVIHVTLIQLY